MIIDAEVWVAQEPNNFYNGSQCIYKEQCILDQKNQFESLLCYHQANRKYQNLCPQFAYLSDGLNLFYEVATKSLQNSSDRHVLSTAADSAHLRIIKAGF